MGLAETIAAMIQQESGGNPNLRNPRTGAMGLMQVMPDTARQPGFGVKPLANPWNADENKAFGTDYFGAMLKRYNGDNDAALAAYNWGPAHADKWVASGKTSPLPAETSNYIRNVNAMAARGGQPNAARSGGGTAPTAPPPAQANGGKPMDDPFSELWGPSQQPDFPRRTPMSIGAGRGSAPLPPRPGGGMGDMANSMVPGIFGGGDQPGYFGKLFSDPTFLTGASVLGGGLAGQDFGSALQRGTQAATSANEMAIRRQKHQAWARIFGPNGPDMNAPLLKGVPPDVIPIIQSMGPDDGLDALHKLAFNRLKPRQLTPVAPGGSLYDEQAGKEVYRAPPKTDAPAGYRQTADGNLEAIPNGPATHLAGDQAGRVAMMRQARDGLAQAKKVYGGDLGITGRMAHTYGIGETGEARRTVTTAIEATLRALTGAAATKDETARLEGLFAPDNFDGPKTRMDKLNKLEQFINDAETAIMQGRGATAPRQKTAPPASADDPLGILD